MTFGDVPVKAPSLLELGAAAVGRHPALLLPTQADNKPIEKEAECAPPPTASDSAPAEAEHSGGDGLADGGEERDDNGSVPSLPAPCVRAVLARLEHLWQSADVDDEQHAAAVDTLCRMARAGGRRMPIERLDLRRSRLGEDALYTLVRNNAEHLRSLSLLECELVDDESGAAGLCPALERRLVADNVRLHSLRALHVDKVGLFAFFAENRLCVARSSRLARNTSLPADAGRGCADSTAAAAAGGGAGNPAAIIRFVDDMVEGILSHEDEADERDEAEEEAAAGGDRAGVEAQPPLARVDSHDSDLAQWSRSASRSGGSSDANGDADGAAAASAAAEVGKCGEIVLPGGFVLNASHSGGGEGAGPSGSDDNGDARPHSADDAEMLSGSESASSIAPPADDERTQHMDDHCGVPGGGSSVTQQASSCSIVSIAQRHQPLTTLCPRLLQLTVHGHDFPSAFDAYRLAPDDEPVVTDGLAVMFLRELLEPLEHLRSLDLSRWMGVDDLRCLLVVGATLTELVLFNVPDLYRAVEYMCELKQLRSLDVSQTNRDTGVYPAPASTLHRLVAGLPDLRSLDLSATNLASPASEHDRPPPVSPRAEHQQQHGGGGGSSMCMADSDIAGLRHLRRPLDFLGLFNCEGASHYNRVPAKVITGDADESQLIAAMAAYMYRPDVLHSVLNETYQAYRHAGGAGGNHEAHEGGGGEHGGRPHRYADSLHLVLRAMRAHGADAAVQIACSACLFYIIRQMDMNWQTRRAVVQALIIGMECHVGEATLVRNCCLSLCQFDVPHELMAAYGRAARLLVAILTRHAGDSVTQRIVVYLLNSMACHVDGAQKKLMGDLLAIETVLQQIERKYNESVCDDVMEVGWSFLWNVTDETEPNCRRFIKNGGLELFHKCYERFATKVDLIRNMMGLIGNLAEVRSIRPDLARPAYVDIFCALLDNLSDGIEISYNAAGVLAHVCSDGADAWAGMVEAGGGEGEAEDKPAASWHRVHERVIAATRRWDLKANRFINYRSFEPILRLVPLWHAPASQHWAMWALANLTTVDNDKYCDYVIREGGLELLRQLKSHGGGHSVGGACDWPAEWTERLLSLVDVVLGNVQQFEEKRLPVKKARVDEEVDAPMDLT